MALEPFPDPFVPNIVIHGVADNLAGENSLPGNYLENQFVAKPRRGQAAVLCSASGYGLFPMLPQYSFEGLDLLLATINPDQDKEIVDQRRIQVGSRRPGKKDVKLGTGALSNLIY